MYLHFPDHPEARYLLPGDVVQTCTKSKYSTQYRTTLILITDRTVGEDETVYSYIALQPGLYGTGISMDVKPLDDEMFADVKPISSQMAHFWLGEAVREAENRIEETKKSVGVAERELERLVAIQTLGYSA